MSPRLYLTGRVCIERAGLLADERQFPGRQGRRAFVYLACSRGSPTPRDELAEAIWPEGTPPAWDAALNALVSKLRRLLTSAGFPGATSLITAYGCVQLQFPPDTWIDVEAMDQAIDEAEGALRAGDHGRAWGPANVAATIARRPFLPGEEGAWVERRRAHIEGVLGRALACLAELALANGEGSLAVQVAAEAVAREPYRESGYRLLMQAYAATGNRAEALRVYDQCRRRLADELGVDPAPETEAAYLHLLGTP